MAEPLKKERQETETLEEWYSKIYDYDPPLEDADKCHSEEFNEWLNNL